MNKVIMYGIGISTLTIAGLAVIPNFASAKNTDAGSGYQQMLQTKADLVGVTKDELSEQLKTKTLEQIAAEKGVSLDQIHTATQKAAEMRWADRGLTESEIASRLQTMKDRQASDDHTANSANRGQGRANNHLNQ